MEKIKKINEIAKKINANKNNIPQRYKRNLKTMILWLYKTHILSLNEYETGMLYIKE